MILSLTSFLGTFFDNESIQVVWRVMVATQQNPLTAGFPITQLWLQNATITMFHYHSWCKNWLTWCLYISSVICHKDNNFLLTINKYFSYMDITQIFVLLTNQIFCPYNFDHTFFWKPFVAEYFTSSHYLSPLSIACIMFNTFQGALMIGLSSPSIAFMICFKAHLG